jgi:hypothetical protein
MADFKRDFPSRMAINMHNEPLRLFWSSYRTMPISLAASSQTQIGSSPFSNLRQRLSQSIMGTKQVKVEETD